MLLQIFLPKKAVPKPDYDAETSLYLPGKYTSTVQLGNDHADVEVVVDSSDILSIRLVNLSQTVTAMYPLVEPCMDTLAKQICENNPSKASPTRTKTATRHSFCCRRSTLRCKRRHIPKPDQPSAFAKEGLFIPAADPVPSAMPCGSHPKASEGLPSAIPRHFRLSVRPAGTNA